MSTLSTVVNLPQHRLGASVAASDHCPPRCNSSPGCSGAIQLGQHGIMWSGWMVKEFIKRDQSSEIFHGP